MAALRSTAFRHADVDPVSDNSNISIFVNNSCVFIPPRTAQNLIIAIKKKKVFLETPKL